MSEVLKQHVNKKSNRNWVRAALSLRYFKQGFEPFIDQQIRCHHAVVLKRVQEKEGVPALQCGDCTSDNLLPNHSKQKKCIQRNRYHCFCSRNQSFSRRHCPNKICSVLYDYIVQAHSTNDPLWTNTNPSNWLTDYWELGKCFLSSPGYEDKKCAADTDATGLISIAINDVYIQDRMDTDIESLNKVRGIRNKILHSEAVLEDDDVVEYIDEMIKVLQDRKALRFDTAALNAIQHLNELKNVQCHISFEDELQVRKETLKAIEEKTQHAVGSIHSTEEHVMEGLRDYIQEQKHQIQILIDEANRTKPSGSLDSSINAKLHETHTEPAGHTQTKIAFVTSTETIKTHVIYTRSQQSAELQDRWQVGRETESQMRTDISEKVIEICLNERDIKTRIKPVSGIAANSKTRTLDRSLSRYIHDKQEIQESLIDLYKQFYIKTDITPLLPEVQIDVDRVYVPPQLFVADSIDDYKDSQNDYYNLYGDVKKTRLKESDFLTNIAKRNILITADAGMGKTALCCRMISAWCAAHDNSSPSPNQTRYDSTSLSFRPEGQNTNSWCSYFRDIDFLFFISLKYCDQESAVEEMILKHLIDETYRDSLYRLLQYEGEKCVVILDDLNAWTPPRGTPESPVTSKGIPLKQVKSRYSTIYTTRPWKLTTIRPKSGEFDMILELEGIDLESSDEHISLVFRYLNRMTGRRRRTKDFLSRLEDRQITHLKTFPLLSKFLLSLWYDKSKLDASLAGIYSVVLDLIIGKAHRSGALSHLDNRGETTEHTCYMTVFADKKYVKKYFDTVVFPLSLFSFRLCHHKRRVCYVFESTDLGYYGLTEEKLQLFTDIGILSERNCYGKSIIERCKTISFIHETFQEYFTAVFLTLCPIKISEFCRTTESILKMSLVFRFISGMNFRSLQMISNILLSIIDNDGNCMDYRCGKLSFTGFVIEMQRMFSCCIKEARQSDIKIEPLALRDVYLGNETAEYMSEISDIEFNKLRSLTCDMEIPLHVQEYITQAHHLDMLVCTHSKYLTDIKIGDILRQNERSLKCLNLSGKRLNEIDILENMFKQLCRLKLSHTKITCEQLTNLITNPTSLEEVQLHDVNVLVSEDVGVKVVSTKKVSVCSSLQHLQLRNCGIVFNCIHFPFLESLHFEKCNPQLLTEILNKSTTLTELTLKRVAFGSDVSLVNSISKQTHLKAIRLQTVKVSQFCLSQLLYVVGNLPNAVEVTLSDVEQEKGTDARNVITHLEKSNRYSMKAFKTGGNYIKDVEIVSYGTN